MGKVVALDSMIFVYLFDSTERYIKLVEPIFSQIESGQTRCLTSIVSLLESLSHQKFLKLYQLKTEITRFFQETPHLTVYPVDQSIALEAATLRQHHPNLKTPDAIQLATALVHHAQTFITNDKRLKSLALPGLTIQLLK